MNNCYVFSGIIIFFLAVISQHYWIEYLKSMNFKQVQKVYGPAQYIQNDKGSTPSMGGVIFCFIAFVSIPFNMMSGISFLHQVEIWSLPLMCAFIGFLDDWIKYMRESSEGFSSIIKLFFQIFVALVWSVWIYTQYGLYLFPDIQIQNPFVAISLLVFFTTGIMNAVNVTDGLDGLAAGSSVISLITVLIFLPLRPLPMSMTITGLAILTAFMWHNAHPAKIFMGDIGSHFIAGLIITLCVYSKTLIAIIPLGFIFGLEILSVCFQLTGIYFLKHKFFLMSPFHHHFELKGWSESQIVTRFWVIHSIGLISIAYFINLIFQ